MTLLTTPWWRRGPRLAAALLGLSMLNLVHAAPAPAFPVKPIRIVVGFGPGGLGDTVTRALAQKMSESTGQSVVVENAPGAGGITAASTVARAAPDGYTLLLVSGQNAFSPYLFKSLPYDPVQSFSLISTIGSSIRTVSSTASVISPRDSKLMCKRGILSGSSRSRVGTFEWKTKRRTKVRVAPQDRFTPVLTNTSRDQPHNSLRVCTKLVYRATTTDGSVNFIDRLPHLHHFV